MTELVRDIYGSLFGPTVFLVRTDMNGNKHYKSHSASEAVWLALTDPDNGVKWQSARIAWGNNIDYWGLSL